MMDSPASRCLVSPEASWLSDICFALAVHPSEPVAQVCGITNALVITDREADTVGIDEHRDHDGVERVQRGGERPPRVLPIQRMGKDQRQGEGA